MKNVLNVDDLIEELEKAGRCAKVRVFKNGKVLELDHNFVPPIVTEIEPKPQEGDK